MTDRQQQPSGVHHIAIMAGDIKKHIDFFSQVMGFPLVAIFDMHGVPGALHAFLRMSDHGYFSIVQMDGIDDIPATLGITHAGNGGGRSAAGTMQHLAFRADSPEGLLQMRDRIRAHGINVMGPLDHGMCQSIYFAGPDGLTLEVACPGVKLDPDLWIDPAVLAKAGISDEEAARFRNPEPYLGPSPVPQPAIDPAKPHMAYPEAVYRAIMSTPDEVLTSSRSYAEPPVKQPA